MKVKLVTLNLQGRFKVKMPQADIYIASLLLVYHIFWNLGFVNVVKSFFLLLLNFLYISVFLSVPQFFAKFI